jgi:hypothetical protein
LAKDLKWMLDTTTGTGTLLTNTGSFSSSKGWGTGFSTKLGGKYQLFADYFSTTLNGVRGIPGNPKGWAVELTNSMYTLAVYYNAPYLVDNKKSGTDAWMVSYRSLDAGVAPNGTGDTMGVFYAISPYNVFTHGSDNVNVLFLAYQKVISKGSNYVYRISRLQG